MERIIKSMENKYLLPSLGLVQEVFSEWDSLEEGKIVRQLVEEIRAKKYYIPELELVMVDENDEIMIFTASGKYIRKIRPLDNGTDCEFSEAMKNDSSVDM